MVSLIIKNRKVPNWIIGLFAMLFAYAAFLPIVSPKDAGNSFITYLLYQGFVLLSQLGLFIIAFFILSLFVFFASKNADRRHSIHSAMLHVFTAIVTGLLLSFGGLLIIACVQLNATALLLNSNPHLLGAETDRDTIVKILKNDNQPPQVVASDRQPYKEVISVAAAASGVTSVYGKYILPVIPQFLVIPIKLQESSLLFFDNTLVITQVKPDDLAAISPPLGYLFIKYYFPDRYIKFYPIVSIMSQDAYTNYRRSDALKKIVGLSAQLKTLDTSMASLSATIKTHTAQLKTDQQSITDTTQKRDSDYSNCLYQGIDISTCRAKKAETTLQIDQTSSEAAKLQPLIFSAQKTYANDKSFYDLFTSQVKGLQNFRANTPHELGYFDEKNHIYMVYDNSSAHALADYFETLTHEYLHYASFNPKKKFSSSFIEEGLTEYFARQIVKENLHTNTNLGYPLQVKLISEISLSFPETDLTDVYFSKDEEQLQKTLDSVYGDNFYEKNKLLFASIQYASTYGQLIDLANKVTKQIGGEPVTFKDLYSSYSNL